MNCHYFVSARSRHRLLFRENEYVTVKAATVGPKGFVLTTRAGAEFRVTTSAPVLIDDVDAALQKAA